ncbi:hypothetical protein FHS76_004188 [Ochrobactrum daejeonense]|uniref:Uncharacterized protein n=1 Tax=Brucella daejeonensis TaxID=659015 RepID=A0A7W9B1E9_9HYPH|nr:hypothetical protein [Brucella daejeonensis]MBB5704271.1 hypothetical protein [Brucella daejeonensis]
MIWALIPSWLKSALAALVAAILVFGAGYTIGTMKERQRAALDAAQATAKAIQERAKIDEKVGGLDVIGLCVELGGLQSDCEQLRRVEGNSR